MKHKSFLLFICMVFLLSTLAVTAAAQQKKIGKTRIIGTPIAAIAKLPDLKVKIACPDVIDPGTDIGSKIKLKVWNAGKGTAPGTDTAGNKGYMVDLMLSTDTNAPAGWATYSANFHEDVLLKGGRVSNTKTLKPGESKTYRVGGGIPADTPIKMLYICVKVDAGNNVRESNENNNTFCKRVKVRGRLATGPVIASTQIAGTQIAAISKLPDLIVKFSCPKSFAPGDDIGSQIKLKVGNKGKGTAPGTDTAGNKGYMVDLILSTDPSTPAKWATYAANFHEDVLLKGGRVSNTVTLKPGGGKYYKVGGGIPADTPAGVYFLCARVDPGNNVKESNEKNNSYCKRVVIRKKGGGGKKLPDLQVRFVCPKKIKAGSDIGPKVKITVVNSGNAAAAGTDTAGSNGYMVDIMLSKDRNTPAGFATYAANYHEDVLLKGGRVSNTKTLAPGTSKGYRVGGGIPADTRPGRYFICVKVDAGNKVTESNEGNNSLCRPVIITR